MTPKENAIKLIEELKQKERALFIKGDDLGLETLRKSIANIRSMFGIEGEVMDKTCESCQ